MKSLSKRSLLILAGVSAGAMGTALTFGVWTTFAYGLSCTKCLLHRHVVEKRFMGVTFSRTESQKAGCAEYSELFRRPCQHELRHIGFTCRYSRSLLAHSKIGCGSNMEEMYFRERFTSVRATYHLFRVLPNPELTVKTFRLIDQLIPPDATRPSRSTAAYRSRATLSYLEQYLQKVGSTSEWEEVLACAREGFISTPGSPALPHLLPLQAESPTPP